MVLCRKIGIFKKSKAYIIINQLNTRVSYQIFIHIKFHSSIRAYALNSVNTYVQWCHHQPITCCCICPQVSAHVLAWTEQCVCVRCFVLASRIQMHFYFGPFHPNTHFQTKSGWCWFLRWFSVKEEHIYISLLVYTFQCDNYMVLAIGMADKNINMIFYY